MVTLQYLTRMPGLKALLLLSAAVITIVCSGPIQAAVPSHCSAEEMTLFSCQIEQSAKVVSLCASQPLSKASALAYRFGKPGNIELEFPKTAGNATAQFRFAHYFRYQVDRKTLAFNIGHYHYMLFDYYEGEENPPYGRGILVTDTRHSDKTVSLLCRDEVVAELPLLNDIVPCDAGNALADC